MPQIIIRYDYDKMAQHGLHVKEVNRVIRTAFAGEKAGVVYEGEKRFDLVIRLDEAHRVGMDNVEDLFISLSDGTQIPLDNVARIEMIDAPMQISREQTNRRIVLGVNVGDTDVESLVDRIRQALEEQIHLPTGYYFSYGGQFENLKAANARLMIAVPLALALIFILLYFTFGSFLQALLIFTAIPLSAIGGIWSLELRDMPFSISAGIGFIALFGVAVLNGIVLIGYFNQLKREGVSDIYERIRRGTRVRLRPVLMTAAVASLGFLPMALSTSGGAEVQRPLATVVIGGLISATFLTLVILPVLYYWLERWLNRKSKSVAIGIRGSMWVLLLLWGTISSTAQKTIRLEEAIAIGLERHPALIAARMDVDKSKALEDIPYHPGMTSLSYEGEGLPDKLFGEQLHQFSIKQQFPAPASFRSANKLQKIISEERRYHSRIRANALKRSIRKGYYEMQYLIALQRLYNEWIDTYSRYYDIAEARVKAGDANRMESLALDAKREEFRLKSRQAELDLIRAREAFRLLLNSDEPLLPADSLSVEEVSPAGAMADPVLLEQMRQKIRMEKAQVDVLKSGLKPGFQLGYSAQRYANAGWLNGVQAGIAMPKTLSLCSALALIQLCLIFVR